MEQLRSQPAPGPIVHTGTTTSRARALLRFGLSLGLVALLLGWSVSARGSAADATASAATPAPYWTVAVSPAAGRAALEPELVDARKLGVNHLLVDRAAWTRSQLARFAGLAAQAKIQLLESSSPPRTPAADAALRAACRGSHTAVDRCVVKAASVTDAKRLIALKRFDAVVLRLPSADGYLRLPALGTQRTRLIGVVPLAGAALASGWQRAVLRSAKAPRTALAVAPPSLDSAPLTAFLGLIAGGAAEPPPETANLWIDPNGGSCHRSADPVAYDDKQACPSMNAAYQVASPGDLILVKGGAYGSQEIRNRSNLAIGSTPVVIQPAPGESATFDGGMAIFSHDVTVNGGDHVGVDSLNRFTTLNEGVAICFGTGGGDWCGSGASPGVGDRNDMFENVNAESGFFNAWGSTLRDSNIGPLNVCDNRSDDLIKGWWVGQDETNPIHDLHLEFNLIHDNVKSGCSSDAHNDAIQFEGADTLIRGNRIWNCGTQCIFEGAGNPGNVFEDNMVEETNACEPCADSTEISSADPGVVVRYNTLDGAMRFYNPNRPNAHATVYGNIFLNQRVCDNASTYSYNVFPPGARCGTNARSCTPLLATGKPWTNVDMQADYHLSTKDTCARGAGDPANFPSVDIDQQLRPQGRIDAGADEVP